LGKNVTLWLHLSLDSLLGVKFGGVSSGDEEGEGDEFEHDVDLVVVGLV
jgi:hypothetical protein